MQGKKFIRMTGATKVRYEEAIKGHILEKAERNGLYRRK